MHEFYSFDEEVSMARLNELKLSHQTNMNEKEQPLNIASPATMPKLCSMMPDFDFDDLENLDELPQFNLHNASEKELNNGFAGFAIENMNDLDEEMLDCSPSLMKQSTSDMIDLKLNKMKTIGELSNVNEAAEEEEKSEYVHL